MTGDAPWSEIEREQIERLFELALGHAPAERAAVLAQACGDPAVRREVESLLAADAQADGFLEPALPPARGSEPRIGHYRLLRKLGEGETSSVYLAARDDDEYHQHVAIKLIRPGMDSEQILQRFHQERQILASLSHPHIAHLLDGGSTPAGQPYFVMEYVDGEPIDVHCEHRALPLARRLELFGLVCQAVHVAHRNLVVHRDLKPGNILVDAEGAPKLVDFGIAKLLDPELFGRERARVRVEPTAAVARLMTPHYASPEQVMGKPVSTASDVYSLGVVLYKLLTGRRPYELGSQSLHEIERVVCESTPPPPSAVLRAERRGRLPRDLDNIVGMAMRKQPERRYASAQELADDLRRCLERRPVVARRDTLGYRASSFVRRNTGAVAAAAVIFLSVLGGAVATTWQWRRAVAERTRAETQRMTAEHTLSFVVDLFHAPDSPVAVHDVTARELLDRGAARLHDDARQPPQIRAALTHTLGVVYRNLGDDRHAAELLEQAVALRQAVRGGELELADSLYQLALVDRDHRTSDSTESLLRRALAIRTRLLGGDDLSVADVLEELANRSARTMREADDGYRRALDIRRHHLGDNDPRLVASVAGMAGRYSASARYDEAEALIREAMAIRGRAAGPEPCHAGDDALYNELGILRYREGYLGDAEQYTDVAIACLQRELGPDHVAVADNMAIRIRIWTAQGRYAEAEALARHGLIRRRALHGDHSAAVDNALYHLGHVLYERGELAEATALETTALTMRTERYGRIHDSVAESLMALGDIQLTGGDATAAEASYREAVAIWRTTLGDDHPSVAEVMRGLAEALAAQDRRAEAQTLAADALALQRRRLRPGHPAIATTLAALAGISAAGAPAAAEPMLREALAIRRAALGPEHPYTARAESELGDCLARQRRRAEALPLLRHGAGTLAAQLGEHHPQRRLARTRLELAEPDRRDD
ncbi:MAG TPA: serine/threonine-protein kinase [Kofleriaceae bacterium]